MACGCLFLKQKLRLALTRESLFEGTAILHHTRDREHGRLLDLCHLLRFGFGLSCKRSCADGYLLVFVGRLVFDGRKLDLTLEPSSLNLLERLHRCTRSILLDMNPGPLCGHLAPPNGEHLGSRLALQDLKRILLLLQCHLHLGHLRRRLEGEGICIAHKKVADGRCAFLDSGWACDRRGGSRARRLCRFRLGRRRLGRFRLGRRRLGRRRLGRRRLGRFRLGRRRLGCRRRRRGSRRFRRLCHRCELSCFSFGLKTLRLRKRCLLAAQSYTVLCLNVVPARSKLGPVDNAGLIHVHLVEEHFGLRFGEQAAQADSRKKLAERDRATPIRIEEEEGMAKGAGFAHARSLVR